MEKDSYAINSQEMQRLNFIKKKTGLKALSKLTLL